MPYQLFPAIPLLLGLSAFALFTLVHRIWWPSHSHQRQLESRARWANANRFAPINRFRAAQRILIDLPGLPVSGDKIQVLGAFEKQDYLVADVIVRADHPVDLRIAGASWQAVTMARTVPDTAIPVMEIRPWVTWPPNSEVVAHRALALPAEDGFATGQAPTLPTGDEDFDKMFVVRAKDKRAAQALLTAPVREVCRMCPSAIFSLAPGAILITEPRLVSDEELDRMVHVLEELRGTLALPPYVARSTVYTRAAALARAASA
jgi:hypothetical protein